MTDTNEVGIAILGYGTVGAAAYELLERRKEDLERITGFRGRVLKILVRDAGKPRVGVDPSLLTDRFEEIAEDERIDVVVELMGRTEPARSYILASLEAGKHVVTANKDLIADYGAELFDLAGKKGLDLLFEASVGGGIPILRPIREGLAGNEITEVCGIVNGTTNYILTQMTENGMEFMEALSTAQKLGYAESDPTADIEGYDAGRKIAILASLCFRSPVTFRDVHTEGIRQITATDIRYAGEFGFVIKLLGIARLNREGIEASVEPMLLPVSHPLSQVKDVFNAVFIHGDAVDDVMFYGRGAGGAPTASAVVGDVIDVMRDMHSNCCGRIRTQFDRSLPLKPVSETRHRYFLRLKAQDRPGVLARVASALGQSGVSIEQMLQRKPEEESIRDLAELVLITDEVQEAVFLQAAEKIRTMDSILEISSIIRVYG